MNDLIEIRSKYYELMRQHGDKTDRVTFELIRRIDTINTLLEMGYRLNCEVVPYSLQRNNGVMPQEVINAIRNYVRNLAIKMGNLHMVMKCDKYYRPKYTIKFEEEK